MATKTIEQSISSIQETINLIMDITEGLSEDMIRYKPSENEWSIIQILSHLAEAIPYWLSEIKHVTDAPGSQWGRGLQDPARLAAVSNPENLSIVKVKDEVAGLKQQVETGLIDLTEEQLREESPHRNFQKFGNKPVSFIIDHFIEEHLEGHYGQIKRNLSKLNELGE